MRDDGIRWGTSSFNGWRSLDGTRERTRVPFACLDVAADQTGAGPFGTVRAVISGRLPSLALCLPAI
jgi:hypothetical protein